MNMISEMLLSIEVMLLPYVKQYPFYFYSFAFIEIERLKEGWLPYIFGKFTSLFVPIQQI